LGPPPPFGRWRLLPSVVELRTKVLVVGPQLADVLGPPQQSCGATVRSSLFARPFAAFSGSVCGFAALLPIARPLISKALLLAFRFGRLCTKNSLVQRKAKAQKVRKKTKKLLLPKYKFNLALCEQAFVAKQLIAKPSTKQHHQHPILGQ